NDVFHEAAKERLERILSERRAELEQRQQETVLASLTFGAALHAVAKERLRQFVLGMKKPVTLKGHSEYTRAIAFSPDGKTLASGGGDRTIKLWDVTTGVEQAFLAGHTGPVWSLAFSPDGKTL